MNDLIDRQSVLDILDYAWDECGWDCEYGWVKEKVINLPTVQSEPEEIARHIATILENEQDMRVILKNAQPQWTPVKERLPEDRVPILITDSEGDVRKGEYWSDDCWQCFVTAEEFLTIHDPVAWMPVPEPYKEGQE